MNTVITFPPTIECPSCGSRLRPARRSEIETDLRDPNYKHIAQIAAQGARDWEPPDEFTEWQKDVSPPGTWLFRCDNCSHRTLWSKEEEL